MKIKVNANLSGAVTAQKGQVITVSADQGSGLIERGLAVEITDPKPQIKKATKPEKTPESADPEAVNGQTKLDQG